MAYKTWHYTNIYESEIGDGTTIGSYTEIGRAKVGCNCKIEARVFIPEGITVEDNVFIGPGVIFTNDKYPPSSKESWKQTVVKKGATIGAGVVILPGVVIGEQSFIGAGAVVTKDIPDREIWIGNPAKIKSFKRKVK